MRSTWHPKKNSARTTIFFATPLLVILFFCLFFCSNETFAWGGRGHHTICSAAVFLVKSEGLRDYLQSRPHMMGHLCNTPDFYWKSLGSEPSRLGNPAHFIDVEIIGLKLSDIPTNYQKIIDTYTGKQNQFNKNKTIFSIPSEFGSLWWRADQFFHRAINLEKSWKIAELPKNSKEEQDENLAYNKSAYDFILNLGLMGHFVGDASQPFHGTSDYDGYATGHGGIHAYFEDAAVSAQSYELEGRVIQAAKKLQEKAMGKDKDKSEVKFLVEKSVVDRMKALSVLSYAEVASILAIDPIKKPSQVKSEKGMDIRTPAEREDIKTVAAKFEPLITQEMARSAALLAQLWDEAYEKVGKPKLGAYKSYKYPFTPDFVAPDYFEDASIKK